MSRKIDPLERLSRLFADPKSRAAELHKPLNPWIVLAIGNPGSEYADTRHNVGWWVADVLRGRLKNGRLGDEGSSSVCHVRIEGQPTIIAYPKTYVNRSGVTARVLMQKYETEIGRLIVVTDDINLSPGRIRVRRGGGDGGHNGLKSIIDALSDRSFPRVRVGVGKPFNGDTQIDHVLGIPRQEELLAIQNAMDRAADAVQAIIVQGIETTMNEFNG